MDILTKSQTLFSVSEFLDFINIALSVDTFVVQGELVGVKEHPTGIYFSVKDKTEPALMDCYLSPYTYRGLGLALVDGMEVRITGAPSIYKPRGRFSFRVEHVALEGEGSLKKAYDALKKKLQEEGLFDRKRVLPEFITSVGLVTSKTGAVIDDFRTNLVKRGIAVTHIDVRVEGAQAVSQVAQAIRALNARVGKPQVIVLVRGGGSMEDLQAFNTEEVTRAVFGSRIPTLVSIGHDRDVPLAQLAADASASTPTGAAMVINESWSRLELVSGHARDLAHAMERMLSTSWSRLDGAWSHLGVCMERMANVGARMVERVMRAAAVLQSGMERTRARVEHAHRYLESVDPARQLRLGYSIVTGTSGRVVRSVVPIQSSDTLYVRTADGTLMVAVEEVVKIP
jgi:exodeoxyribonuclease VII large subunit